MKNGEKYPLKDFFSGINEKIIIPDLQRDYCWGDSGLVENFLDSLLSLERKNPITLGLIYGYVDDKLIAEHMQLCDGQQRLTTIFLLLGQLYRLTGDEKIKRHLISDFELNRDDREPYLLYSIRESSIYFLSDLTYYYFLSNSDISKAEDIKNQPWYIDSYNQDPSIVSILRAIAVIEEKLEGISTEELSAFGTFLLEKVEFLFVDMEDRKNGEETFVIINTTGEPLTANENLKARFIRAHREKTPDVAALWEDMEQWFWNNRCRTARVEHTSDEGFQGFVNVVKLLTAKSDADYIEIRDNIDKIPFEEYDVEYVKCAFKAYKRIYTLNGYDERFDEDARPLYEKGYSQSDLFRLLPILQYVIKFPTTSDENILRLFHIFRNFGRYRSADINLKDGIAPAYRAFNAVKGMPSADIANLFISDYIPAEEERKYHQLCEWAELNELCKPIETIVADIERNPILNGNISFILDCADGEVEAFKRYADRFNALWPTDNGHELDTLRCALLCLGLSNYPLNYSGGLYTLCNDASHWSSLITNEGNFEIIKALMDDNRSLEKIIEESSDKSGIFKSLVDNPEWFGFMERGNILLRSDSLYVLMQKERSSSGYWLIFHDELFGKYHFGDGWQYAWYLSDNSRLYCHSSVYDLKIVIEAVENGFRLNLEQGEDEAKSVFQDIDSLASQFNMFCSPDYEKAYSIERDNIAELKQIAETLAKTIAATT